MATTVAAHKVLVTLAVACRGNRNGGAGRGGGPDSRIANSGYGACERGSGHLDVAMALDMVTALDAMAARYRRKPGWK